MLSKNYGEGLGFEKNPIERYAWLYVAANSTPRNAAEKAMVEIANLALPALEAKLSQETRKTALDKGQKYLKLYGSASKQ